MQFSNIQPEDYYRLGYLILLLVLLGSGLSRYRTMSTSSLLKMAGVWIIVLLALVAAYAYRNELVHNRVAAELVPTRLRQAEGGEVSLNASMGGHFYTDAEVNGVTIRFLIDTGASDTVISPSDAALLGLSRNSLEYNRFYETANGLVSGASVNLDYISIGDLRVDNVEASVNGSELRYSLLGMSFLKRLSGYRVEGDTLTLIP